MDIFNYQTFDTSLSKKTRSLTLTFKRETINREMLFELEGLFNWLSSKVEISSLILTSHSDIFCQGIDLEDWKDKEPSELQAFLKRFSKLTNALTYLPQTVIADLRTEVAAEGIELALCADIRIARSGLSLNFNFLERGLMPQAPMYERAHQLFGMQNLKNWIYSKKKPSTETLLHNGFLLSTYSANEEISEILTYLRDVSPISRLQSKMAFKVYDVDFEKERIEKIDSFQMATLSIEDWKKEKEDFTPAREIGSTLKRKEVEKNYA